MGTRRVCHAHYQINGGRCPPYYLNCGSLAIYFSGSTLNFPTHSGQQKYIFLPLYSVKNCLLMGFPITGQIICSTAAELTSSVLLLDEVGGSDFLQPLSKISPADKRLANKIVAVNIFILPFVVLPFHNFLLIRLAVAGMATG